jgi:hypothetical protein
VGALALPAVNFQKAGLPPVIPAGLPAITETVVWLPFEPFTGVVQALVVKPWYVRENVTPLGAAATDIEASVKLVVAVPDGLVAVAM